MSLSWLKGTFTLHITGLGLCIWTVGKKVLLLDLNTPDHLGHSPRLFGWLDFNLVLLSNSEDCCLGFVSINSGQEGSKRTFIGALILVLSCLVVYVEMPTLFWPMIGSRWRWIDIAHFSFWAWNGPDPGVAIDRDSRLHFRDQVLNE